MVIQKLDEKLMKNENFQKTKFWATRIDINLYCFEYKVHISKIKCRTSVHTFLSLSILGIQRLQCDWLIRTVLGKIPLQSFYEIRGMMVLLATLNDCNFKTTEPILKVRHALERGDPNSFISGVFCSKISSCPTKKWRYIMVKSRKSAFTAPLMASPTSTRFCYFL